MRTSDGSWASAALSKPATESSAGSCGSAGLSAGKKSVSAFRYCELLIRRSGAGPTAGAASSAARDVGCAGPPASQPTCAPTASSTGTRRARESKRNPTKVSAAPPPTQRDRTPQKRQTPDAAESRATMSSSDTPRTSTTFFLPEAPRAPRRWKPLRPAPRGSSSPAASRGPRGGRRGRAWTSSRRASRRRAASRAGAGDTARRRCPCPGSPVTRPRTSRISKRARGPSQKERRPFGRIGERRGGRSGGGHEHDLARRRADSGGRLQPERRTLGTSAARARDASRPMRVADQSHPVTLPR